MSDVYHYHQQDTSINSSQQEIYDWDYLESQDHIKPISIEIDLENENINLKEEVEKQIKMEDICEDDVEVLAITSDYEFLHQKTKEMAGAKRNRVSEEVLMAGSERNDEKVTPYELLCLMQKKNLKTSLMTSGHHLELNLEINTNQRISESVIHSDIIKTTDRWFALLQIILEVEIEQDKCFKYILQVHEIISPLFRIETKTQLQQPNSLLIQDIVAETNDKNIINNKKLYDVQQQKIVYYKYEPDSNNQNPQQFQKYSIDLNTHLTPISIKDEDDVLNLQVDNIEPFAIHFIPLEKNHKTVVHIENNKDKLIQKIADEETIDQEPILVILCKERCYFGTKEDFQTDQMVCLHEYNEFLNFLQLEQKTYEKELKDEGQLNQTSMVVVSICETQEKINEENKEKEDINNKSPILYITKGQGFLASNDDKQFKKMKDDFNQEFIQMFEQEYNIQKQQIYNLINHNHDKINKKEYQQLYAEICKQIIAQNNIINYFTFNNNSVFLKTLNQETDEQNELKKNFVNEINKRQKQQNLSNDDEENYFQCRVDIFDSSERNVFLIYQDQQGSLDPLPVLIYHFVDKRSTTPQLREEQNEMISKINLNCSLYQSIKENEEQEAPDSRWEVGELRQAFKGVDNVFIDSSCPDFYVVIQDGQKRKIRKGRRSSDTHNQNDNQSVLRCCLRFWNDARPIFPKLVILENIESLQQEVYLIMYDYLDKQIIDINTVKKITNLIICKSPISNEQRANKYQLQPSSSVYKINGKGNMFYQNYQVCYYLQKEGVIQIYETRVEYLKRKDQTNQKKEYQCNIVLLGYKFIILNGQWIPKQNSVIFEPIINSNEEKKQNQIDGTRLVNFIKCTEFQQDGLDLKFPNLKHEDCLFQTDLVSSTYKRLFLGHPTNGNITQGLIVESIFQEAAFNNHSIVMNQQQRQMILNLHIKQILNIIPSRGLEQSSVNFIFDTQCVFQPMEILNGLNIIDFYINDLQKVHQLLQNFDNYNQIQQPTTLLQEVCKDTTPQCLLNHKLVHWETEYDEDQIKLDDFLLQHQQQFLKDCNWAAETSDMMIDIYGSSTLQRCLQQDKGAGSLTTNKLLLFLLERSRTQAAHDLLLLFTMTVVREDTSFDNIEIQNFFLQQTQLDDDDLNSFAIKIKDVPLFKDKKYDIFKIELDHVFNQELSIQKQKKICQKEESDENENEQSKSLFVDFYSFDFRIVSQMLNLNKEQDKQVTISDYEIQKLCFKIIQKYQYQFNNLSHVIKHLVDEKFQSKTQKFFIKSFIVYMIFWAIFIALFVLNEGITDYKNLEKPSFKNLEKILVIIMLFIQLIQFKIMFQSVESQKVYSSWSGKFYLLNTSLILIYAFFTCAMYDTTYLTNKADPDDSVSFVILLKVVITILSFVQFMQYLTIFKEFSVLIALFGRCFEDLKQFCCFFMVYNVLFTILFSICGKIETKDTQEQYKGLANWQQKLIEVCRNSFSDFITPNNVFQYNKNETQDQEHFIYFMQLLMWITWFVNVMVMVVVLLNFLIAIINHAYEKTLLESQYKIYETRVTFNLMYESIMQNTWVFKYFNHNRNQLVTWIFQCPRFQAFQAKDEWTGVVQQLNEFVDQEFDQVNELIDQYHIDTTNQIRYLKHQLKKADLSFKKADESQKQAELQKKKAEDELKTLETQQKKHVSIKKQKSQI